MKNNFKHMSLWGVGPVYVAVISILTISGLLLFRFGLINFAQIASAQIPMDILGGILMILGIILWYSAVITSRLDQNIIENKLVTKGVYAWVRNPIYSAFAIAFTGLLLMMNNLCLLILPLLFWVLETILVRMEEKNLVTVFGTKYLLYKESVNRCIPWLPREPRRIIHGERYLRRSVKTFNKRSQNYDSTAEGKMAGWLKALVLEHIQLCNDDRVLDVACGTGKLLDMIYQKAQVKCYGVDISEGMIQTASRNHPNMEFCNADCANIPYPDSFFDVITNNAAYHHFIDPSAFAGEAFRVLKKDGYLYIAEIRLPRFLRKLCNCLFILLPTGDVKVYAAQEIVDNFLNVGFQVSNLFFKGPIQLICFKKNKHID